MFYAGEDDGRHISIRAFRYIYGPLYTFYCLYRMWKPRQCGRMDEQSKLGRHFFCALGQSVIKDVVGDA
jgi:hypothetical protein